MVRKHTALWLVLAALSLAACGGGDAGSLDETTGGADAGGGEDGGLSGEDAGHQPDSGPRADAGGMDDAGGSGDVGAGEDTGSNVTGPCTPDPSLVDGRNRCQTDDQCPCGTHCDLGECAAACTADEDCADGESCDTFGRCRSAQDTALVPAPPAQAPGRLSVKPRRLVLATGAEATVQVRVHERDVERARALAEQGLELRCPGEADFTTSCLMSGLQADEVVDLIVRRTADAPADQADSPSVTVFGPAGSESVSVLRPDQLPGYVEPGQATPVEVAGRYTGTLRLVGAGSDASSDLPPAPAPTTLRVEATVWDSGGQTIVAIDDPYDALTSAEQFVGTLNLGADDDADGIVDGQASFVAHPFVEATVAGVDYGLVAETTSAAVRSRLAPRTLSMEIIQSYRGHGATVAPSVRWVVELRRSADAISPAPALPAAASLGFDPAQRLAASTPWEDAFAAPTSVSLAGVRGLLDGEHDANLCVWSDSDRAYWHRYLSGFWMAVESTLGAHTDAQSDLFSPTYSSAIANIATPRRTRIFGATLAASAPWSNYANTSLGGGLSCAFTNFEVTADPGGYGAYGSPGTATNPSIDFCDALAASTGCRIKSVNIANSFQIPADFRISTDYVFTSPGIFTIDTTVTRVCELPSAPASCGEEVSCLSTTSADPSAYTGSSFAQTMLAQTADLECANSGLAAGLALDRFADTMTAREVLDTCVTELAALSQPAPAPNATLSPDDLFDLSARCVDVGRLLAAIEVQSRTLRPGAAGLTETYEARASSYTQRLLSRWLKLHGFLATETGQIEQMADYFRRGLSQSTRTPPLLDELLATTTAGWDLFVTADVGNAVLSMPDGALVEPDHRFHRFGLTGAAGDEQEHALAEVILQTLTRQFELVRREAEINGATPAGSTTSPLEALMPRMLLAQALAADMHQRALAADPSLPWAQGYAASGKRAHARIADTIEYVVSVDAGANPLGIEDADLPIYFVADDATGAAGRFSAISDYVAGGLASTDAIAPKAVLKAKESLALAEGAYADSADRQLHEERRQQWRDQLRTSYNDQLRDFCGPLGGSPIDAPNFNAANCALRRIVVNSEEVIDPACAADAQTWYQGWTEDDLLGKLCLHAELDEASLSQTYGFAGASMRQFAAGCYTDATPAAGAVSIGACTADPQVICLRCDWSPNVAEVALDADTLKLVVPDALADGDDKEAAAAIWLDARSSCTSRHPQMRMAVPLPNSPFEVPGCMRGSIGDAYLDIVAAEGDVQSARQAIVEHNEAYDIAMESCFILKGANAEMENLRNSHADNMQKLRIAKATADSVALAAGAVKDCASTAAGSSKDTPWAAIADAATTGIACAAGGVEAAANIASVGLGAEMERAQLAHENAVANVEADAELEICFNDAKQELVGLKAATLDLETAVFDLQRAQAEVDEQVTEAQRAYEEGHAYFEEIANAAKADAGGDQWGEAAVATYIRDFKLARRATYLAVRAVEYEYQQSLAVRQEVFDAVLPHDLEPVLQEVQTDSATRRINGNAPSELTAVVSLRDDVLRLGDESGWPDAMHPLTPAQRFHLVLSAERYAIYDDAGHYLGQRIPFKLAPLGALDFDAGNVSIYSKTDCAERLWSVNAGIVGDGVYRGSDTSFARIDLLKRNTFYSQWCSAPGADEPAFQHASVRPSRNLFREPGLGAPTDTDSGIEGVQAFSRARLQAYFGVDRATMESSQYDDGASSELAARGMYGDYAVFIPAELISRDGGEGLILDRIDDILLRVDYLSVAKP